MALDCSGDVRPDRNDLSIPWFILAGSLLTYLAVLLFMAYNPSNMGMVDKAIPAPDSTPTTPSKLFWSNNRFQVCLVRSRISPYRQKSEAKEPIPE